MQVKLKKLHHDAITPKYATDGSGCFDLHAIGSGEVRPGNPYTMRTGLSFEIPEGHVMFVFSRSGHGFKLDVRLSNCVGVIDSDYRGEVLVKLTADSEQCMRINPGDRIAQAIIIPFPRVSFIEADELTDTARGEGGYGSTGK